MRRIIFSVTAVLTLLMVSYLATQSWNSRATGMPGSTSTSANAGVAVELTQVTVGHIAEVVRAVGTLAANESVVIRPEIAGVVTRVLFTEGQAVEKGAVLIELDDTELRAQVAQVEAELKIAHVTYDRMKQLIGAQNNFISQQQIDQAVSALQTAQANHTLYLTRLAKTKIRAPFTGYIGIRRISPGEYIRAGDDLVNLEDLRTLKIDFKIPEAYLNRLSIGQRVNVVTDPYPDHPFTGSVYALDPRIDASSRAARVRATVPNTTAKLRPGLFANVELILGEKDQALLIPEESIVRQRDKTLVYRVTDQTARLTEVGLGAREQGMVEIVTGLGRTDTIVRTGHQKLKDGARVASK